MQKTMLILFLILLVAQNTNAQCYDYLDEIENAYSSASDANAYADDAYSFARKAYYADNLDDIQYYAKKAMSAAEDIQSSASDAESYAINAETYAAGCNCSYGEYYASETYSAASDASTYADEIYSNARKAYNSDNLDDAQYYAKKAMRSAEDAQSSTSDTESYASDGSSVCDYWDLNCVIRTKGNY